jgi:hypothetical protein
MTDYSSIPEYMVDGVRGYLEHGWTPGSFLYAVLCNNLKESAAQADDTNKLCLFEWACFMYNEMPSDTQGSPEVVNAYLEKKRAQRQDS